MTRRGPAWAIVRGLIVAMFGYLAASSAGMATAPSRGASLGAMAVITVGAALIVLGLVAFVRPQLRPMTRWLTGLTGALLVLSYFIYQLILRTGMIDG